MAELERGEVLPNGLEVPPGHHFLGVTTDGKIMSATSGVTEWTEDGEVYGETEEDRARKTAEHRAVVMRWRASLTLRGLLPRRRPSGGSLSRRRSARRPRIRRHAARRASGVRSGADPGGGDPEPPPGPGFALFRALTPGLDGATRLALFHRLPESVQARCWRGLAEAVAGRAS